VSTEGTKTIPIPIPTPTPIGKGSLKIAKRELNSMHLPMALVSATVGQRPTEARRCGHLHRQVVQRARHTLSAQLQHVGVNHRRGNILVPQQRLDRPNIGPPLQ